MNVSYKGGLSVWRDSHSGEVYFSLASHGVECKPKAEGQFRLDAFYIPTDPEKSIMPRGIYLNSENAAIGAALKLLLHLCGGGTPENFSAGDGLSKTIHRPRGRPKKTPQ